MQDHVYVQYLELNAFQQRFRELANSMAANERLVHELPAGGNTTEELNAALVRKTLQRCEIFKNKIFPNSIFSPTFPPKKYCLTLLNPTNVLEKMH